MGIIIKNTSRVTAINMIGVLIAAISILFVQTKFLTDKEIGAIKVINSLSILIYPFILMGLGSAIMKFHHFFVKDKKTYNQFLTYVLLLPLPLLLLFSGLSFVLNDYISANFLNDSPYLSNLVFLLPGMIFYWTYSTVMESFLSVQAKIIFPNFLKNIASRLYLILLVVLYATNTLTFTSLLVAYVALHVVNSCLLLLFFFRNLENQFKFSSGFPQNLRYKEFTSYSLYLVLGSVGSVLITQVDILMTGALLKDLGDVGIYTVAYFLGVVIEIPRRPVVQISAPIISKDLAEGNLEKVEVLYQKSAINLLIVGGILFVLIWVNIEYIFQVIPNGDIYVRGKYVFFFIGLSKLFDLAVGVNYEIIQYSKYYKWNIFLTPFLALMAIGFNYYFILKYGIVGTAIATAITILLYNLVRSLLVYFKFKMNAISYRHVIVIFLACITIFCAQFEFTTNIYLGAVLNSLTVGLLFILPIYLLKISTDLNSVINKILLKANIFK